MNHDIVVVEHDPMRMRQALDRERMLAVMMHPLLDAARNRLHLDVGASGCNHEIVGNRVEVLDFEQGQIVGLLFQCRLCDGESFVDSSHAKEPDRTCNFVELNGAKKFRTRFALIKSVAPDVVYDITRQQITNRFLVLNFLTDLRRRDGKERSLYEG